VLLKLGVRPEAVTFAALAAQLGMSASEVHAAMKRAASAMLLDPDQRRPRVSQLLEFLQHGIRYVFISRPGGITRGVPTAYSAPPLNEVLRQPGIFSRVLNDRPDESEPAATGLFTQVLAPPLVWPHPEGEVRGESLEPLYPSAVDAARRDPKLYECLALVDALRVGRAREKNLAIDLLSKRLRPS